MEGIETAGIEFCAIDAPEAFCLYSKKQQFLNMFIENSFEHNITIKYNTDIYPKEPWDTSLNVLKIIWTVLPVVPVLAITRIITSTIGPAIQLNYFFTYLLEFVFIVLPIVFFVSVYNNLLGYLLPPLLFAAWFQYFYLQQRPRNWFFNWGGRRPYILTLNRATINLLTAYCILAVDFPSFPKYFVKTHQFGASLMDIGIGLFVYSMGVVSQPPQKLLQFAKLLVNFLVLIILGLIRIIIMEYTDFSQDEREYGIHWNAFITLAFTKLVAMLVSVLCQSGYMLFAGGVVFAVIHEVNLQHNTSNFVMNVHIIRNTFFKANREGYCSLLGFISIYLFSMFIGHYLRIQSDIITRKVYFKKLRVTLLSAVLLWMSVFSCIFLSISIARVTCNLGYILLVLAIAQTMTAYYMMGFHSILSQPDDSYLGNQQYLPSVVEAVNKNGLVYFVVANLLTGGINLCLEEKDYILESSIIILCNYMFLAISAVQILHYFNKRIG